VPTTLTGTDQDGLVGTKQIIIAGANVAAVVAGVPATALANVSHNTPGQTFSNMRFARVNGNVADLTYNDCYFEGDNTTSPIYTATNIAAKRIKFNRCVFSPKFIKDRNAFTGHDLEFYDCLIEKTTDGISVNNGSQFAATGAGWQTGIIMRRTMIRRLVRWTANATGVVHPSDSNSHNDGIQIFGGLGMDIEDCVFDARPARQAGHLWLMDSSGHVFTEAEAYNLPDTYEPISVPMGSLADGGPFAFAGDSTHPARPLPWEDNGSGLLSRGRINKPDWAAFMFNSSQGWTGEHRVVNSLFMGGEYTFNGGGNPNPGGGVSMGTYDGLIFDKSQGTQGQTINFGGTWTGHATVTNCKYIDGTAITVRY
jgi:hypothetical protein